MLVIELLFLEYKIHVERKAFQSRTVFVFPIMELEELQSKSGFDLPSLTYSHVLIVDVPLLEFDPTSYLLILRVINQVSFYCTFQCHGIPVFWKDAFYRFIIVLLCYSFTLIFITSKLGKFNCRY